MVFKSSDQLQEINSQVCKQKFSLLLKHVPMIKHMSEYHFGFFFMCLFTSLNEKSIAFIRKNHNGKQKEWTKSL